MGVNKKNTPSSYIKDRLLSTRDKLGLIEKERIPQIIEIVDDREGNLRNYSVDIDRPLFQPSPSIIQIQGFEAFKTYDVVINFKNVDSFTRRLKLEEIQSPYFKIQGWKSNSLVSEKVAPGMEASFVLKFKPEEKIDYSYDLVCGSEREKFIVPIRATGARALFDFPDEITFLDSPVNYKTSKTILVRNIGNKDAKFTIDYSGPFEIVPDNGFLAQGKSLQIDISFNSKVTGSFSTDLCLTYDTGESVYAKVLGTAEDALIRLEKSLIQMDNTSMGLISYKVVKLINNSDIMAKFCWKDHFSETEEQLFKSNMEIQLYRDEAKELEAFHSLTPEQQKMDVVDVAIITEKYKNLRKKINSRNLFFTNNSFRIEPSSGVVWPASSIDLKVYFHPKCAERVSAVAYCEVEGRESRLHLSMKGNGIGPKARFSYDVLDLEEIFVHTEHRYDVVLENRGDIELQYSLREARGVFGPSFRFIPSAGHLNVGEQVKIDVFFAPDNLGSIYEEFEWDLNGSSEPLLLTFKGKCIGPNIHSNIDKINFGKVSFGFSSCLDFQIINTSQIFVNYEISLKGDADNDINDFTISNQCGIIDELSNKSVQIQLNASQVKVYKLWLVVDICNVQKEALKIPIIASVMVPSITAYEKCLSFDECYLSYPYQKKIALKNPSNYQSKFELMVQEEDSKSIYSYFSTNSNGVIKPNSTEFIDLNLIVNQLGHISFTLLINILGRKEGPIALDISAFGVGPDLSFSTLAVNWGKVDLLTSVSQPLKMKNGSPIPASFICSVVGESSVFSVDPCSGCILPGEEAQLTISAFLDDAVKFTDLLRVRIHPDKIHEIQLTAKGMGTPIVFDSEDKSIDFGNVFSNIPYLREIALRNHGRRAQTITWQNKDSRSASKEADSLICFSVSPSRTILKPGGKQIFAIKGHSIKSLSANETLVCFSNVENNPNKKIVFETNVRANFVPPMVIATPNVLEFVFQYADDQESFNIISQYLNLKNASSLPLHIDFRCPDGYYISLEDKLLLKPDESQLIPVFYDPSINKDRISAKRSSKLIILYDEHPQKDFVELVSDILFPNVSLSLSAIDFECISLYTEKKLYFTMANSGSMSVNFRWHLEGCKVKNSEKTDFDFGQVFDITPNCGDLLPGEVGEFEVRFFGHDIGQFSCHAICGIKGGPRYSIKLSGKASNVDYLIDKTKIDFSAEPYQNILEQEILLTNRGNVVFGFEVLLYPKCTLSQKLAVFPSQGILQPNEKQKLQLKFCNCSPETINDFFYIQIASFEPIPIQVCGSGVYSNILMDLPRAVDPLFDDVVEKLKLSAYSKELDEVLETKLIMHAEKMILSEKTKMLIMQQSIDDNLVKSKVKYVGSDFLFGKTVGKKSSKALSFNEASKINLVTYTCDFGTMIKGTTRKKVIHLRNCGDLPVSINLEKIPSNGLGITIEPDRFKLVAPNESAELTISIVGKTANGVKLKSVDSNIFFSIQGGPMISINVKALVTIPELSIAPSTFDFGEVVNGQRKTAFFQFQNTTLVPLEWTSKAHESWSRSAKPKKQSSNEENVFIFDPQEGCISPGENQLVKVLYYPAGDFEHSEEISINIMHNPRPISIQLRGRGSSLRAHFDMDTLNLGPILPYSEGAEAKVNLINSSNYPIEIYSLDFDKQYLEDEASLRRLGAFEDGILYTRVCAAGSPLENILNDSSRIKAESSGVVAFTDKSIKIQPENFLLIVVHGEPFSGKSSVCSRLSKHYGIPSLTVDQIIETSTTQNTTVNDESFSAILGSRIQMADCCKGFILDGLETLKYNISPLAVLKELSQIHPLIKKIYLFNLDIDFQVVKSRELAAFNRKYDDEIQKFFVKELSEAEYDLLNESAKIKYDIALEKYKKKLKEIEGKKQSTRKAMQEEYNSKVADKNNDDKFKRRKLKAVSPARSERPEKEKEKEKPPLAAMVRTLTGTLSAAQRLQGALKKPVINQTEEIENEMIFNDEIFRLHENYTSNIEAISTLLKEINSEKSSIGKATEKKSQEEESLFFTVYHIDASQDLDFVMNNITVALPQQSVNEEVLASTVQIPEPYVEQIINYPSEREPVQRSLYFSIISSGSDEIEQKYSKAKGLKMEQSVGTIDFDSMDNLNQKYRWILSPGEKKELCIRFYSSDTGKFSYIMDFEITGQRTRVPLKITGTCQYSGIIADPKKIFTKVRKAKDEKTAISGEYILSNSTFEFGPLLYSKPRDKYLDKYSENHGTLNLINPGETDIKINIALKNDIKGDTFFFDPPSMEIAPGSSQVLHVWAYPKTHSLFEDTLIVMVKDNPEPYFYRVSCMGVRPELEVDKKTLAFDKMLLGRVEARDIKLKNPTLIPVAWRITGLETLGDDFDIWPVEGILENLQECTVSTEFCGLKPLIAKKLIRFEVSDTERIGGVAQEIPIVITAEAYDIAMDVHFPKGYDGGLDFGVQKVFDEGKQICTLKNKGKYEVGFRFLFENPELNAYFTISPQQGILQPSDKPFFVQFLFKSNHDIAIKDHTACKCQIYEPATEEIPAIIPIKLCARAVFSKFTITPGRELNFGPVIFGAKHNRQFVIENSGEFEFKYHIYRLVASDSKAHPLSISRAGSPNKLNGKKEVVKQTDLVTFGAFTVSPMNSTVPPKSKMVVHLEFNPDSAGLFEEFIAVDISDRSPTEYPDVMEYRVTAESCIPGINNWEFTSIFEEHTVMKRLEMSANHHGVYVEEDRVFYFGSFLVGQQIQGRFKISNPFKVSCEVSISVKQRNKAKGDNQDPGFDVEPKKLMIPNHEYRYVSVSFHPSSIQSYSTFFEAVVENVADNKFKSLCFEIQGEGTLPKLSIERPVLKSKTGLPLLKFKRLLVGTSQTLQLVLKNDGIINTKFKLEYSSKDLDEFECLALLSQPILKPNESKIIDIKYKPTSVKKVDVELKIKVLDNLFEELTVQLSGEGYLEDFTFDNLPNDSDNEIAFGDCQIGESKQISFTISNHSAEVLRVTFPDLSEFSFYPSCCHLNPKGSREIIANFFAKQPVDIQKHSVAVKASKIKLVSSNSPVQWHDRMTYSNEPIPEPSFESLSQPTDYPIFLSALADFSSFDCDSADIIFKNTMMFQSRVHSFAIKNTGKVSLRINMVLFDEGGYQVEDISNNVFTLPVTKAVIEAGESLACQVKFSPNDAQKFRNTLVVVASNTPKDSKPTQILLRGSATRPLCHFELEESNYLLNQRVIPDINGSEALPTILDPATRVIEFFSCGIRIKNVKRFYIVNPTNFGYEFEWSANSLNEKSFQCITPKGLVAAGKKFEILFEYFPETSELKESLWTFTILNQNVTIPFLLVGQTIEPNVFMDRTSLNFKSILINRKARETVKLINNELMPFQFSFEEMLFDTTNDQIPVLSYSPSSGVVPPKSEIPIDIIFTPNSEKIFNFNLICHVKRKSSHLGVNIKGEGYDLHDSLVAEQYDGSTVELAAGPDYENLIDFGMLQINDKGIKRVLIINSGKYNFDFSWKLPLKRPNSYISIHPLIGTVPKGERVYCEISYHPTIISTLKNFNALCQIVNGQAYNVSFIGSCTKPLIRLSQKEVNFGSQFLYNGITLPSNLSVSLVNEDVKEATLDILDNHSDIFELNLAQNTLQPGQSTILSITFFPREAKSYEQIAKIEVNGLSAVEVTIFGEGTEFRVEPIILDQRNINFGATRVGHTLTRTARIINRSTIPATFTLGPLSAVEFLKSRGISMGVSGEITMKPKAILPIEFKFQPTHRIQQFSEDLTAESCGMTRHLLTVTGCCQGILVQLENDTLPFGAVVQKSSTTRKLQLQNIGDIGTKFSWDVSKFWPDFSVVPSEGYISPGMDLPLEITFHPVDLHQDIRYERLQCTIEGSQNLYLTLTGTCIAQPSQLDIIKFSVPVRGSETKSITLSNKANTVCNTFPIIENSCWRGAESFEIEPGQSKVYDITFSPLEMNGLGEGGKHEGTVFFPLPDGSGILYKLIGVAEKPAPSGNITREIPCKTNHIEVLNVQNWLKRPQRFKVIIELSKPDFVTLKGPEFIDVPPLISKDYKLNFYAHKEGLTNAKIIFKNEQNQEYLYWNLSFKSTAPGVISTLDMSTTVRIPVIKEIAIFNPLSNAVTFSGSCQLSDINVPNTSIAQPKSELIVPVEFLPLTPKEATARLIFTSTELGTYIYDLKLTAVAGPPERSIHFKVGLGACQTQIFRFLSLTKSKTEYSCKIDSQDFTVEKSVVASAASSGGSEVNVEITYEPSHLGDVRSQLIVSSPIGGDFICPLFGHCIAPRPQGPIIIKMGTPAVFPFKNVLNVPASFSFLVDNPVFSVKSSENIAAKKSIQLSVGVKLDSRSSVSIGSFSKTGKLTITTPNSNVVWIYYLKLAA